MELELELENLKKKYEELLKQQVDLRKRQIEPVIYLFESLGFSTGTSIERFVTSNFKTLF